MNRRKTSRIVRAAACAAFAAAALALAVPPASAEIVFDRVLRYRETTEGETVENRWRLGNEGDLKAAELRGESSEALILYTAGGRTVSVVRERPEQGERIRISRTGDTLLFEGYWGGENVRESEKIEDVPWYGTFFLIGEFAASGGDETPFVITIADGQRVFTMKAIREETGEIEVPAGSFEAVRVKVTFPDIRGLFWSSRFWFRAADGVPLRSEERRGGPGTPLTVVELIAESPSR